MFVRIRQSSPVLSGSAADALYRTIVPSPRDRHMRWHRPAAEDEDEHLTMELLEVAPCLCSGSVVMGRLSQNPTVFAPVALISRANDLPVGWSKKYMDASYARHAASRLTTPQTYPPRRPWQPECIHDDFGNDQGAGAGRRQ